MNGISLYAANVSLRPKPCNSPSFIVWMFMTWMLVILLYSLAPKVRADYETALIAKTIWGEARGESYEGKHAVASVIWNRAIERGLSLHAVCIQKSQFSYWNERTPDAVKPSGKAWHDCLKIAEAMRSGMFRPSGDWNHYYNPKLCHPKWAPAMENIKRIGNHIFGRIPYGSSKVCKG